MSEVKTETQKAIEKVDSALAALREGGKELFAAEISKLEKRLEELKQQARIEAGEVVERAESTIKKWLDKIEPYRKYITTALVIYLAAKAFL